MKLKSRGLGRKELVLDFRRYDIRRDGDEVLITGTITQPVTWDFSIRIEDDDIPGLIRVARSRSMVSLFFRWLGRGLKRNKGETEEKRAEAPRRSKAINSESGGRRRPAANRPDAAERRRKIEEARRNIASSKKTENVPKGERPSWRAVRPTPQAGGWGLSRVGAIPSGPRVVREKESVGPSGQAHRRSATGNEEPPEKVSRSWSLRRPGALPKVS